MLALSLSGPDPIETLVTLGGCNAAYAPRRAVINDADGEKFHTAGLIKDNIKCLNAFGRPALAALVPLLHVQAQL